MEEVKASIFQVNPLSAPGPDGLPELCLSNAQDIVGLPLTKVFMYVLNNKASCAELNDTLICLIPKKNKAITITEC